MSASDRADKIAELKRLGVEYDGQSTARVQQWADELEFATVEQVRKAVQKCLDDPERKYLPRIGELKSFIPRPACENPDSLDGKINSGHAVIWSWDTATITGSLDCLTNERREREAAFALLLFHPSRRDSGYFQRIVKPMILKFDLKAFEHETDRLAGTVQPKLVEVVEQLSEYQADPDFAEVPA